MWGQVELEPEVGQWFLGLPAEDAARVRFHIDRLAEFGVTLDKPHTRQLDGKTSRTSVLSFGSTDTDHILDRTRTEDHPPHRVQEDPTAGAQRDSTSEAGDGTVGFRRAHD